MLYILSRHRYMRPLLLGGASLLLAACGSVAPTPTGEATEPTFAYVAPIDLETDMTRAELETIYNGTALSFNPEAGFAILGFSEAQGKMSTLASLELNDDLVLPEEEAEALGWDAWAGGWDAWAGGWDAWAGGWDAWAGGSGVPTLPGDNGSLFEMIGLPDAHAATDTFGEGVTIAIIDSGLDLDHPMFAGRLSPASQWKDFVDRDHYPQDETDAADAKSQFYGHGTAAAGIVAQVAPRAKIMPLRVLEADGKGKLSDVISAIDWAVANGADVINLSLGTAKDKKSLKTMIDYAAANAVHIVASSGNAAESTIEYPARYANSARSEQFVLSVGSVSALGTRSLFSNYGPELEFLAPGEAVVSAYPDNRIGRFTGTSFAAPMVSGMVALGLEGGVKGLENHLSQGAAPVLGFNNGHGVPNSAAMLQSAKGRH